MVNGGTMILKLNVCMSKNDGCVLIMVHNRYFFACVQQSWTTLAGASPVAVIASEPCS